MSDAKETLAQLITSAAARHPAAAALVFPESRQTYAELLDCARARARELTALGVGPGDRFGILAPNCSAFVEFLLGGALLGATVVPINARFRPHELAHVISNAELTAVVTTASEDEHTSFRNILAETLPGLESAADPFARGLEGYPHLRAVLALSPVSTPGFVDTTSLAERTAGASEVEGSPTPESPLLLMYTSGTTANPKGCVISNHSFTHNARAIVERLKIGPDDRWWDPLPLFHMGGVMLMTSVFAGGGSFASMAHFEARAALELIERERSNVLYPLFPTITLDLMHEPTFADRSWSHVRLIGNIAPLDVQIQVQEAFAPAVLIGAYGITELTGVVSYNELDESLDSRLGTCGPPLPGLEMRVVDPETNEPLPPGERGELVGRGIQRFDGYFANAEQTAAVVDADGYFHTGDLCSIDEEGRILYHGRLKDMLKVGGENVAALEVESYLSTHPAVKLAQVVGVPDPKLLEVPAAFVELVPGETATEEELIAFCTGAIARFKVPRHVRFVSEWPMSATKIQKFRLRDQLLTELADAPPSA